MRFLILSVSFIIGSARSLSLTSVAAPPPLNSPVFSLATVSADGITDMNILTYVSPVGIRPARKWVVSLYKTTKTYENFLGPGTSHPRIAVLQLLRKKHADLVYPLGGQSGRDVDKSALCSEKGFRWVSPKEMVLGDGATASGDTDGEWPMLLPGCAAYYRVSVAAGAALLDAGDHEAVLLNIDDIAVESLGADDEEKACEGGDGNEHMSTALLRELGIITDAGRAVPPVGEET